MKNLTVLILIIHATISYTGTFTNGQTVALQTIEDLETILVDIETKVLKPLTKILEPQTITLSSDAQKKPSTDGSAKTIKIVPTVL